MFAATAAGIYDKVVDAMAAMGQGFDREFYPDKNKVALYSDRYNKYKAWEILSKNNCKGKNI